MEEERDSTIRAQNLELRKLLSETEILRHRYELTLKRHRARCAAVTLAVSLAKSELEGLALQRNLAESTERVEEKEAKLGELSMLKEAAVELVKNSEDKRSSLAIECSQLGAKLNSLLISSEELPLKSKALRRKVLEAEDRVSRLKAALNLKEAELQALSKIHELEEEVEREVKGLPPAKGGFRREDGPDGGSRFVLESNLESPNLTFF